MAPKESEGLCRIYDRDGSLLTLGIAERGPEADTVRVTRLTKPGVVVQRFLVGRQRDVHIAFDGSAPVDARVDNVYFDPKHGRGCALRLHTAPVRAALPA